jgi:hypothetical protein
VAERKQESLVLHKLLALEVAPFKGHTLPWRITIPARPIQLNKSNANGCNRQVWFPQFSHLACDREAKDQHIA